MLTMCQFLQRPYTKSSPSLFMFFNISLSRPKGNPQQRSHIRQLFYTYFYYTKPELAYSGKRGTLLDILVKVCGATLETISFV